jgi:hypothetical protein
MCPRDFDPIQRSDGARDSCVINFQGVSCIWIKNREARLDGDGRAGVPYISLRSVGDECTGLADGRNGG